MRNSFAIVIATAVAFLVGLLVGRYASGGLTLTNFALSAALAALIPIAGTVAQIYFDRQRESEAGLRDKQEAHAARIAEGSLVPLCSVEFFGREGELAMAKASLLPLAVDFGNQGGKRYVEGLRYWKYAALHIAGDTSFAPVWIELEKLGKEWNDQKFELDRLFYEKAADLVRKTFGRVLTMAPDWIDPPPDLWYNPGRLAEWTRRGIMDPPFKQAEQTYPAAPGRGESRRQILQNGPYTFFGASEAGLLTEEKASEIYQTLLNDSDLQLSLASLRSIESRIRGYLPGFLDAAWDFCQRVEASEHLPGTCEICKDWAT